MAKDVVGDRKRKPEEPHSQKDLVISIDQQRLQLRPFPLHVHNLRIQIFDFLINHAAVEPHKGFYFEKVEAAYPDDKEVAVCQSREHLA